MTINWKNNKTTTKKYLTECLPCPWQCQEIMWVEDIASALKLRSTSGNEVHPEICKNL